MKCKVLVFGFTDNIGGIENYYINYYRKFNIDEFQIDFVTSSTKIAFEEELKKNSKIFKIAKYTDFFKYIKELKKIFNKEKYDIVHLNMLSCANILPLLIGRKTGTKNIIVHSHNGNVPKGFWRKILNTLNKNKIKKYATCLFACSKVAGDWMFGKAKYEVIPNQVSFNKFKYNITERAAIRRKLNLTDRDVVIGHIGRFSEQKNHFFLIEIIKEITRQNTNVKFMFIGDGELKQKFIDNLEMLGLKDNAIFTGMISDTYKYYNAFDLFILPSLFEGLPLVAIEAQVNGLPCVFSDKISREATIINNDVNSVKYVQLDKGKWINAINDVINNGVNRKCFSLNEKYDSDNSDNILREKYLQLINK